MDALANATAGRTLTRGTRSGSARYVGTTAQGIAWWAYSEGDFAPMCEAFDALAAVSA